MAGTCGILSTGTLVLSTCGDTRVTGFCAFYGPVPFSLAWNVKLLSHTGSQVHLSNLHWIMIQLRYTHKISISDLAF